jgi:hypothetical protein
MTNIHTITENNFYKKGYKFFKITKLIIQKNIYYLKLNLSF